MNILFLSNIATPYQLDLLKELNAKSDDNIYGYFLFSKKVNRSWSLELPKYVYIANYSQKISDYRQLYKFIEAYEIDKILIGGYAIPTTIFTTFISKIKNIDLYFWLERPINEQSGIKKYLKELYLKFLLSQAVKVFAIGKLAVDRYSLYHRNVVNLPYSMNLSEFYKIKRKHNRNGKIRFLFSGQYINRKNIINIIKAFKLIENKNLELNLIGGGELQAEVSNLIQNDNRVNDIGFVQPKELPKIYANNDIFLMPSKHDGWALVINEAMASGMPIISTSRVGAIVEYLIHNEGGFVCDIDEKSIQKGIQYYTDNVQIITKQGLKNREIIKLSLGDVKLASVFLIKELKRR